MDLLKILLNDSGGSVKLFLGRRRNNKKNATWSLDKLGVNSPGFSRFR